MKTYYSDYCGHIIRQYKKLNGSDLEDEVTNTNVTVCGQVLQEQPELERRIIELVYDFLNINDGVNHASKCYDMRAHSVWMIVKNFEKTLAKRRGLI